MWTRRWITEEDRIKIRRAKEKERREKIADHYIRDNIEKVKKEKRRRKS